MPVTLIFEKSDLQGLFGNDLFQRPRLTTWILDLPGWRFVCRVPGEPLLADLQELFQPAAIEASGDTLAAAQRGYAVLTPQALQDYADLNLLPKFTGVSEVVPENRTAVLGGIRPI